jgi:hypothetical protein
MQYLKVLCSALFKILVKFKIAFPCSSHSLVAAVSPSFSTLILLASRLSVALWFIAQIRASTCEGEKRSGERSGERSGAMSGERVGRKVGRGKERETAGQKKVGWQRMRVRRRIK